MRTFELDIRYPYYCDMLGGGFVEMRLGFFPFKARNQETAERRAPRILRKFHKEIDGDKFRAKAVALRERIEYVVELKKF